MGTITIQIAVNKIDRNKGQIEGLPKNPRFIRDEKFELLKKSIQENPEMLGLRELLVYPVGERYVVIGGNMRLEACKALGYNTVPCKVLDADTPVETLRAYTIKDNAGFGEWDWDAIANEWDGEQLADWGVDVPEWDVQTDDDEQKEKNAQEDDFDEEKDKVETVCKKGDIWLLGQHRLMCGDSTDKSNIEQLMGGQTADMLFTDPPYGMFLDTEYDGMFANDENHKVTGKRFTKVIGDNDDFKPELINTIFDNFGNCKEMFIWGADYFSELIPNRKDGTWEIWDKRCSESMDKVAGNTFEMCWSKCKHKKLIARILWSGHHGMNGQDSGKRVHPTQKPIKLIEWFINNWGKDCKSIVDIYGGSGSTLIACEQLGRKCYMMELDPHYCDVIIARWEKLTGQKAVRLTD